MQLTRVYGYSSVEEYMEADSPIHTAHNIHIPTLAVSSMDDPVCCVTGCPVDNIGPGLALLRSEYGGHLAFPSAFRDPAHPINNVLSLGTSLQCTWTDGLILDWFQRLSL